MKSSDRSGRSGPLFAAFGAVLVVALVLWPASPALAKYASLVIDAETGRVLHEVNADTRNYPASLTKMMTLYMVFEALENGRLTLDTRFPVSARAARQPAARLGLAAGQAITVRQAILALVTKSANDVASVIADALGGGERDFALMMTAKARKLGMSRTTFRNASGLPHRGQLSTARDMGTLARALLIDMPQYYHYFSTSTFSYGGASYKNHNNLLASYQGTDGIKTGYISASGYNLVASVRRGNYRLIGVVFGGDSAASRDRHMMTLLDKAFKRLGTPAVAANSAPPPRKPSTAAPGRPRTDEWGIQVGAYSTFKPAYEMARKAVSMAPRLLAGGQIKIVPLERRNRAPLYRARILSLSKQAAYGACDYLERRSVACMELKVTDDMRLAFAGR